MKIVYIATSIIPSRTANSIHVMKMCQAFAQNGHEVVLIVPDIQTEREPEIKDIFSFYGVEKCFEIQYLPMPPVKGRGFIYGVLAGKKAKELHPNFVYGRDLPGCFTACLLKLPVVFESHAPIEGTGYSWIFQKLIARPTFKKLVVITHALKNYYSRQYPLLSDKIIVAPDGADPVLDTIKPVALPNKSKRLQVGYVGHLYAGRGIDVIYQLAERCPWADFNVIGGTEQDINKCKTDMPPLNNVRLYGFKQPGEVERYRIAFDVLLAPYQNKVSVAGTGITTTERWMSPLKIFEYMATGKAIICSDIPVLREVLENGHNALLCPPENVDAWEKALVFLDENEGVRKQLGENARNDFLCNYTWGSRAKNILRALE